MKITYNIGKKKITYNTSSVPPIGASVEIVSDDPILSDMKFTVTDVRFKLFYDAEVGLPGSCMEEIDVFLSVDACETLTTLLMNSIDYTSTST